MRTYDECCERIVECLASYVSSGHNSVVESRGLLLLFHLRSAIHGSFEAFIVHGKAFEFFVYATS